MTKILEMNSEEIEVAELLESTYVRYHDLVVSIVNQLEEVVKFDVFCGEPEFAHIHGWIGQNDFASYSTQIPAFGRFHTLELNISSTQFNSTFRGFIELEQPQEEIRIEIWSVDYPPRIFFGEKQLNRAMGLRYQKQGDETALRTKLAGFEGTSSLYFHRSDGGFNPPFTRDRAEVGGSEYGFDNSLTSQPLTTPYPPPAPPKRGVKGESFGKWDVNRDDLIDMIECLVGHRIDLWLNGEKVNEFSSSIDFLYPTIPIFHEVVLPAGIHMLMIGLNDEHRILFDGEILMDGIWDVLVRIEEIDANPTVKIERGTETLYSREFLKPLFSETFYKKK